MIENLNHIFSRLCETLGFIYAYPHCLHVFVNPNFQEIDLLSTTQPDPHTFRENNISYSVYSYGRENLKDNFYRFLQLTSAFHRQNEDRPTPERIGIKDLNEILCLLGIDSYATSEGILILFDQKDLKNLGMFIHWRMGANQERKKVLFQRCTLFGLAGIPVFISAQSVYSRV